MAAVFTPVVATEAAKPTCHCTLSHPRPASPLLEVGSSMITSQGPTEEEVDNTTVGLAGATGGRITTDALGANKRFAWQSVWLRRAGQAALSTRALRVSVSPGRGASEQPMAISNSCELRHEHMHTEEENKADEERLENASSLVQLKDEANPP